MSDNFILGNIAAWVFMISFWLSAKIAESSQSMFLKVVIFPVLFLVSLISFCVFIFTLLKGAWGFLGG
jgi:hypothetical protein